MELFEEIQSGCEADFCQPLIHYIRMKKEGRVSPPYIPRWDFMPLHKLCQLALLWLDAGFEKEASELAGWLVKFEKLNTFWCREKEYNTPEIEYWFSRLSKIRPIESEIPATFYETPHFTAAFTLSGNGTTLGALHTDGAEIRALGPQSDAAHFGIQGKGMKGWTRTKADTEVWFHVQTACVDNRCDLDVRFVGLTPEKPLVFAFYVKAESCQIGSEVFKPKCLKRYQGEASSIQFQNLKIESSRPAPLQLIPLAGEGCFWDCEFLATFEIHPVEPQLFFSITN